MREVDAQYFDELETRLDRAIDIAETARERGEDPTPEVEIPVATDMADRVENILGIDGVAERVRELEGDYSRERAALMLVEDFVEGTVGDYDTRQGKVEGAVRTAVALLTEGVVAAPIEGIDRVELRTNDDGTEFVSVAYAGPIRSAGGTAQALSVLVADYARSLLGIEAFQPREEEIERYAEEIALYDKETGLQYTPSDEEATHIARNVPIMLDGEATGDGEVSGYRDLERVDTNSPRGGMCLVLAEGIALKAPKIKRYTDELDDVEWPWLQALIDGDVGEDDAEEEADGDVEAESDEQAGPPRAPPKTKYLRDLIAGRPVFSHPSEPGGFRLRYGRARNHGFATAGVHPATMHLVDDFLATGTQIKTERPGKAAGVIPVDSIEGPTVKLANGDVRRIDDPAEALEVRNGVEAILDVGEYLVNYGEFVENNKPLAPASYTTEWWVQDLAAAGADVQALRDSPYVDLADPEPAQALNWARDHDAPLHPAYTYLYHDISVEDLDTLAAALSEATIEGEALSVPRTEPVREILEVLLIGHHQDADTLQIEDWQPLAETVGVSTDLERQWALADLSEAALDWENAMKAIEEIAPFEVRERAPTRIGNRMGRPEKSESRDLSPAVHTLFPIGEAGGNQRDVGKAAAAGDSIDGTQGTVEVELGERVCVACGEHTYKPRCPACGERTKPYYECPECSIRVEPDEAGRVECPRCERSLSNVDIQTVDVGREFNDALAAVEERETSLDIVKGVKGLMSKTKVPEPMEKGVLRAKHGVTAFKDGTVRYDMTDLPVTAVRPAELDVTVADFRELGYETDINGDPLEHADQLVELRVQDVILSDGAAEHMLKTADFVDELLTDYYELDPFYELEDREDLIGELVFGMAPHTSAAVVGRVAGFTSAAVGYAHPYFHASKRRNCFHPETKIWFEDENGVWHYDRISDLVEPRLDPETADEDDFGTLVQDIDETVFVPSLSQDGEIVRKPVEAVSKHQATDHMVTIETRSGREVTVTPDHDVHVFDGSGISAKMASEVSEDDSLVTPANLDVFEPSSEPKQFDLLAEFLSTPEIDPSALMVKGFDKEFLYDLFESVLAKDWDGEFYPLQSTAKHLGLTKKALSNYIYRESIPASLLLELLDSPGAVIDRVPGDVTLGMKRDRTEIDRTITLDTDLATLIGYYTAEGFARKQETPKGTIHQTTISGVESTARDFFVDTFENAFGVEPYRENEYKVTVSGRLMRVFFEDVLAAGLDAAEKRAPDCIFDATKDVVAAFLSGYFSGDGTVEKDRLVVSATTVSKELKEDLLGLLTRLGITARVKSVDPVKLAEKFPDVYDPGNESTSERSYVLTISSTDAVRFGEEVGFHLPRKHDRLISQTDSIESRGRRVFDGGEGDYLIDEVAQVTYAESKVEHTYSLTVPETHSVIVNDTSQKQCDGDEDCVMLLMDGLLNFSKQYLPDQRGGRMDAPLVMSSRIDPAEIDDEAHNVDTVDQYPREFYEATREMADPGEVDIEIAEAHLGTDRAYSDFGFTHDTSDIALGPDLSAYKTLESMMDKMEAQLELARKLRAVDETDVAERVIEYHFLPDLIGNLRAFTRQEVRCLSCGAKYRRAPLTGECRKCGGDVTLTVHEGSVTKYLDTAIEVAEEYGSREYTKQRLHILERSIESIFENDKNKQSGIADFM
ncbi:DNA polymerase II large subunit [Halodesulfurarchaeum sp. HSR-GB]|uniref:DNA polymerase II large subunit n=1 Tax=Halodesulfurarchaeum sp. HSR-GB TaxID=3074077 RepID=UPI00285B3A91|nr:DNA polymerase II large subunit [Halodesulfurarchaeum sp. HSR-GB]MDR5656099.1 DNA polymerase II large subunit [Halodesulfurarchaeum sp. HSR-GB]